MDINYGLVGLAILLAAALVIFLILKNRKDRKTFEESENRPDLPPGRHEDESERL